MAGHRRTLRGRPQEPHRSPSTLGSSNGTIAQASLRESPPSGLGVGQDGYRGATAYLGGSDGCEHRLYGRDKFHSVGSVIAGSGVLWLMAGCMLGFVVLTAIILTKAPRRSVPRVPAQRLGWLYVVVAVAAAATLLAIGLPWWIAALVAASFTPAVYAHWARRAM